MARMIGAADMGSVDDMGAIDNGPGGTAATGSTPNVRPIGVSPAVHKQEAMGEDWWRGNKWPPTDVPTNWQNVPITRTSKEPFPDQSWTPYWYSIAVIGEFVKQAGWDGFEHQLRAILDAADLKQEIDELVALIDYRAGVMTEALAQCDNIIGYFRGVLSFTPYSHPWTYGLAMIALRVGEFQVMHYKARFNRPRASRFAPALMPPIEPPGHASFPSGHSTQSHLMALCLAEVMPKAASNGTNPDTGQPDPAFGPLQRLAERVARNREVLGVHYPSDSEAGRRLALGTFPLLMKCPTVQTIADRARSEW
jgi:membrane-associated phospholipid phosphatase